MSAPIATPTLPTTSRNTDPSSLHVDVVGAVVGALVVIGAPTSKPSPTTLRNVMSDALDRAFPQLYGHPTDSAFLGSLPDVVTPVAALGIAVRVAVDESHRWVHNRQAKGSSRWTYCGSTVTEDTVSILGRGTSAEVASDGTLTVDADVPSSIANRLRDAYHAARGVVEPSRVLALVAGHLAKQGGRAITSSAYLMPEMPATTAGVLAGLCDLGGFAASYAVADPAQIQALAAPVVRSVEDQIQDVTAAAQAFVARAVAVAAPFEPGSPEKKIQSRSLDTIRAEIEAARKAAALWRDRLSLVTLDVEDALATLDSEADKAGRAALAAMDARRNTPATLP